MTINDVIQILETSPRMGAETDTPEGVRYIQISDTLARLMAQGLREWFQLRED